MMEFIRGWIMNITVVIIFTMLLDMMMPNGDMKRFTKVIMGLLIILVIVKPFMVAKNWGTQFEATLSQTQAYLEDEKAEGGKNIAAFQNSSALELYKEKLSEKVVDIVKDKEELKDRNVKVNIDIENDINKENFGSITAIQVFVDKGKNGSIQATSIQPVKINAKTVMNKSPSEYKLNDSKLSQDLCSDINEALGLKETVVSIEIQE
jgi:stage III sporulation protein AF